MDIDLTSIRTVVYASNPVGARRSVYQRRRERCKVLLDSLGYKHVAFYFGPVTKPYWHGLRQGHTQLIRHLPAPVLILEDDVLARDRSTTLVVPDGCQVCYLGGSHSGDPAGVRAALTAGHKLQRRHKWAFTPIDDDWVRVFGVYNTHAILWLDSHVQETVANELATWTRSVDAYLACNQHRWFCCLKRVPSFWQNDGHHTRDTWAYHDLPDASQRVGE